jgi:hypothetical protein
MLRQSYSHRAGSLPWLSALTAEPQVARSVALGAAGIHSVSQAVITTYLLPA